MTHDHASPFDGTARTVFYRVEVPRKVPGLFDLHRMAMLLMAETAPTDAEILVVGAGGGMETLSFAEAQQGWRFTGVDPSRAMLDLARSTLSSVADRVTLIEGTVHQAPHGPFDGAASLLTMHHVEIGERQRTLREIHERLKPGARFVVAGHSSPGPAAQCWMTRSVAFGDRNGLDWSKSEKTARVMVERLALMAPEQEKAMLCEAGFSDIELFYAAFSFRGFVATA